jgi:hypothetical protein
MAELRGGSGNDGGCDVVLIGAELEENLALRYLVSACQRAGQRAMVVPFAGPAEIPRVVAQALAARPLVIGLSMTFQSRCREFMELAAELRRGGFAGHLTAGGHFATLAAEALLRDAPALDTCVRNEGEEALVELVEAVRRGDPRARLLAIPGLAGRDAEGRVVLAPRRRLPPLAQLAWPDRSRPAARTLGVVTATVLGSRGCYAECSFCSIYSFSRQASGPRFRLRPVPEIADELAELHRTRGVRVFNFNDDTFFLPSRARNLERLGAFSRELGRRGLDDVAFVLKCRPDDVEPAYFEALAPIKVIRVYVGIENQSEVGLRSLARGVTPADNVRALRLLREQGVYHTFNLLLFDPDTTMASIAENLALLEAHPEVPYNFCRTEIYVGTPLEARLAAEGRLHGDYLGWGYRLLDERAELMFRIASVAFHQRNFAPDGMATLNMGLRYDLEVLRHFHPDTHDAALRDEAVGVSRAVGESSARRLREIHAFTAGVDLGDEARIQDYTVAVARAVHRDDFALLGALKRVRGEIAARAARAEARPRRAAEPPPLAIVSGEVP